MNNLFTSILLLISFNFPFIQGDKVIVDASYTFDEAVARKEFPQSIREDLRLVDVEYYSFDNKIHKGQLVVHKDLVNDVKEIFKEMMEIKFPVEKVIPIVKYGWSDNASMEDNNSSAFNYRTVAGTTRVSNHAMGRAVDINPRINPEIRNGVTSPKNGSYNIKEPGTIAADSYIVKLFIKHGWSWGGDWQSLKDYQHFEKTK